MSERERLRKGEGVREIVCVCMCERERMCAYVCVCVCVREREREKETEHRRFMRPVQTVCQALYLTTAENINELVRNCSWSRTLWEKNKLKQKGERGHHL